MKKKNKKFQSFLFFLFLLKNVEFVRVPNVEDTDQKMQLGDHGSLFHPTCPVYNLWNDDCEGSKRTP